MADKPWTLLIVDDDAETRVRVAELMTVAGFSALTAPNGARALEVLRVLPGRCLILLDLDMPVMSGEEFLVKLLELPKAVARFPVVVVSGKPDAAEARRLPSVMAVLPKPFTGEQLLKLVREHMAPAGWPMR